MQSFYDPDLRPGQDRFTFSEGESRHIVKVLRYREGHDICLTNGKGDRFKAELELADAKRSVARILSEQRVAPRPYQLHVAIAPTKMNERFEWFLEKATELGVDRITPIRCSRSERNRIKPERFERILQAAMKQSLGAYLPELRPMIGFRELVANAREPFRGIAHCGSGPREEWASLLSQDLPGPYLLAIGPEGDFDPGEVAEATDNGFRTLSLGPSRLRTETAGIYACAVLNAAYANRP